jgi:hypothetical protein
VFGPHGISARLVDELAGIRTLGCDPQAGRVLHNVFDDAPPVKVVVEIDVHDRSDERNPFSGAEHFWA